MSVVDRERAPECAASRARRASGREAAIRNFSFCVPKVDARRAVEVAIEFECKVFLYKVLYRFIGELF